MGAPSGRLAPGSPSTRSASWADEAEIELGAGTAASGARPDEVKPAKPPTPKPPKSALEHLKDRTGMFDPKEVARRIAAWQEPRGMRDPSEPDRPGVGREENGISDEGTTATLGDPKLGAAALGLASSPVDADVTAAPGRSVWSDVAESKGEPEDLRSARSLDVAKIVETPQPSRPKTAIEHLIDGTGMFDPQVTARRMAAWNEPRGCRLEDSEVTLCGAPDSRETFARRVQGDQVSYRVLQRPASRQLLDFPRHHKAPDRPPQDGRVRCRPLQRDSQLVESPPRARAPSPPPGPPGDSTLSQIHAARGRGRGVGRAATTAHAAGGVSRGGGRAASGTPAAAHAIRGGGKGGGKGASKGRERGSVGT
eukprot:2118034-Prymnesium_polylepis.1